MNKIPTKLTTLTENQLDEGWCESNSGSNRTHFKIDLKDDSMIVCFVGRRGGGKTTLMTLWVCRCVMLYNSKILSNYPIEFILHRNNGRNYVCRSEPLDMEKLLCFDAAIKNSIICLDEAGDIISHLAWGSVKNKLLNLFIRQIRKNGNSLFLASQDFHMMDRGFRWQTDIIIETSDLSRVYGDDKYERGSLLGVKMFDNSRVVTQGRHENSDYYYDGAPMFAQAQVYPKLLWGDEKHKPVFNSWNQLDVFESLRKAELHLPKSYSVGVDDVAGSADEFLSSKAEFISQLVEVTRAQNDGRVSTKDFYEVMGELTPREKDTLGKALSRSGVKVGQLSTGARFYDMTDFDKNGFLGG